MIHILAISALLASSLAAMGETLTRNLPESPEPVKTPQTDCLDRTLLYANIAVRLNDTISTPYMLRHGWHERFLPNVIAHHPPVMAAYSGAVVLSDWMVMRHLEKRGHRKLARAYMIAEIAQDAYWGGQNWRAR